MNNYLIMALCLYITYLVMNAHLFGGQLGRLMAEGVAGLWRDLLGKRKTPKRGGSPSDPKQQDAEVPVSDPPLLIVQKRYLNCQRLPVTAKSTNRGGVVHIFESTKDDEEYEVVYTVMQDEDSEVIPCEVSDAGQLPHYISSADKQAAASPIPSGQDTPPAMRKTELYATFLHQVGQTDTEVSALLDQVKEPDTEKKNDPLERFDIRDYVPGDDCLT